MSGTGKLSVGDLVLIVDRELGSDPNSKIVGRAVGKVSLAHKSGHTSVRITKQIGQSAYVLGEEYRFFYQKYLLRLDALTALAMESE